MKQKYFKKFLLIIIFMFLITIKVEAESKITCSDVTNEIENYNSIVTNLEKLECGNVEDDLIVSSCNAYKTEKSLSLSKLFYYNDNTNCNNQELDTIIKENKDQCSSVFGSTLKDITNNVMIMFYVIAPFLLIIFGMLDFTKIVTMGDPKTISESRKRFVRRLIYFILVLLIPAAYNFIMQFNVTGLRYDSNIYSCSTDIKFKIDTWDVTYVPRKTTTTKRGNLKSGSASNILDAADKVHKEQITWTYSVGGDLFWNNIEKSLNNPNKVTCCATYVGTTLYVAGLFTESEMNSYNYNLASATSEFLASKGWTKITNYNDLQAGDIVFMTSGVKSGIGHTQIYAGNGTWYNAGSTDAIRRESPYSDTTYSRSRFIHAYRKP